MVSFKGKILSFWHPRILLENGLFVALKFQVALNIADVNAEHKILRASIFGQPRVLSTSAIFIFKKSVSVDMDKLKKQDNYIEQILFHQKNFDLFIFISNSFEIPVTKAEFNQCDYACSDCKNSLFCRILCACWLSPPFKINLHGLWNTSVTPVDKLPRQLGLRSYSNCCISQDFIGWIWPCIQICWTLRKV